MQMDVVILIQNVELKGILEIPLGAEGLVVIVNGTKNNKFVENRLLLAKGLNGLGIGTLLFDLLVQEEASLAEKKSDIETLTERLIAVTKWCMENEKTKKLRLGYFGSGIGGGASLSAAAYWGTKIKAVVCSDGRPDLAMEVLDLIESPTLLIVTGEDKQVIEQNKQAYQKIGALKKMEIIPADMEKVLYLTGLWMAKYL